MQTFFSISEPRFSRVVRGVTIDTRRGIIIKVGHITAGDLPTKYEIVDAKGGEAYLSR